jgi:hypothetical protein
MANVAPAGNGNVDAKLDEILNLVMACSRGEVGNDAVESALSSIVSEHAPSSTSTHRSQQLLAHQVVLLRVWKRSNLVPYMENVP